MVRALELNTDIGYIPEKSNKTGNGIENFLLQKISQLESHKPRRVFKNLTWSIITFASPTFQKIEYLAVTFLAITYPSTREKNICSQMTEWLKRQQHHMVVDTRT